MTLMDRTGRSIAYLRLSLTPACQMRCTYCRPAWLANEQDRGALTARELTAMVAHLIRHHSLKKVRLTGGDPTAHPELLNIIRGIASIGGLDELAMTTNGLSLAHRARDYARAGVGRVNVSLDSLDRACFERMTGVDGLDRVLAGIDAALDAGLAPLRLNTVVLRGDNDRDLPDLVAFAADKGVEIRFIELMPMGPLAERWAERYVPESRMRSVLGETVSDWRPLEPGPSSARSYDATLSDGRRVTIGFITPMSCNFCGACNRLRITSRGELYPCLMDRHAGSLMPAFRPRFDAARFDALLARGLAAKKDEHPHDGFAVMTTIGG